MSASTDTFRTALHGFNRTDVVQYIQKINGAHEKELRALREENEQLTREAESLKKELAVLQEKAAALEAERAAAPSQPAAAPQPQEGSELAAYRRAEQVERKARERAEATTRLLKDVFAKANDRLCAGRAEFDEMTEAFDANFSRLHQLFTEAKSVFDASAEELKEAESSLDE